MRLEELGDRICVLGPSNSGKSTLATAIARKRGLRAVHLDQLHHLPHTNWQVRPSHEFVTLHDAAVANDRWVIDGNYSALFSKRFERATGVILLDISTSASLFRYVRRTLFDGRRFGALEGGQDSIKSAMLYHIGVVTPANRKRYAEIYRHLLLPKIYLNSIPRINECYRIWGLKRVPEIES
jgi:adenylate kinase family enzyme